MNNVVQFNNHNIDIITYNGQTWMAGSQIGKVLGYENAAKAVHNIYTSHKDEFDNGMSCTLKTRVQGQLHKTRIFNREGAWLIGMFARTPKAVEFRKWVLKVLGAVADKAVQSEKAVIVQEHTRSLPTGKKEIVLSDRAKSEINGIVQTAMGVEINKLFTPKKSENWEVSNNDLLLTLSNWYRTMRKEDTIKFRKLSEENNELRAKITQISSLLK